MFILHKTFEENPTVHAVVDENQLEVLQGAFAESPYYTLTDTEEHQLDQCQDEILNKDIDSGKDAYTIAVEHPQILVDMLRHYCDNTRKAAVSILEESVSDVATSLGYAEQRQTFSTFAADMALQLEAEVSLLNELPAYSSVDIGSREEKRPDAHIILAEFQY